VRTIAVRAISVDELGMGLEKYRRLEMTRGGFLTKLGAVDWLLEDWTSIKFRKIGY